jgi:hypothetical protein
VRALNAFRRHSAQPKSALRYLPGIHPELTAIRPHPQGSCGIISTFLFGCNSFKEKRLAPLVP